MTNTFNIRNLEAGLATFVKLPLMQERHDKAVEFYTQEVVAGTPHRQAIEHTLVFAIKGGSGLKALAEPDQKLQIARQAAGIAVRPRLQSAATPVVTNVLSTAKAAATKTVETVKATTTQRTKKRPLDDTTKDTSPKWVKFWGFACGALGGLIVGSIIASILAAIWRDKVGSDLGNLAYWLALFSMTVVGVYIGLSITRHMLNAREHKNSEESATDTEEMSYDEFTELVTDSSRSTQPATA